MRADRLLALAALLPACGPADPAGALVPQCPSAVIINEVMAAGATDWIELYNPSDRDVDLAGYGLTRVDWIVQFTFEEDDPRAAIPAGGYLRVWADPYEMGTGEITTLYDLNRDGDTVYLLAPEASWYAECDGVAYPDQHQDVSWARVPDGEEFCYAVEETPGASNQTPCYQTD